MSDFTAGRTLDEYRTDAMLRSPVERQFEIAGEALAQLLRVAPTLEDRITDCRRIIAFRDRLIHGYAQVADDIVWGIIEKNLPVRRREVANLLAESSP